MLAFLIFNTYMLLFSTQVNAGFAGNANILKFAGHVGVLTVAAAWYASAAGVINGMRGSRILPVGGPLLVLNSRPASTR